MIDEIQKQYNERKLWLYTAFMSLGLRPEEVVALDWDCIFISDDDIASENARIYINKALANYKKADMEETGYRGIIFVFPNDESVKSTLVLKEPKTEESERVVYLPNTIANKAVEFRALQEKIVVVWGHKFKRYGDYEFVFAQDDGRPSSVSTSSKHFKETAKQKNLPPVPARSLRHTGITEKLRATHDIKAVQGDGGHTTSRMSLDVYSDIIDEDRKKNAVAMEKLLFNKQKRDN